MTIRFPTSSAMASASSPNKRYSSLAQPIRSPLFILVQPSLRSSILPPQSLYSTPTLSDSSLASALTFMATCTLTITRSDSSSFCKASASDICVSFSSSFLSADSIVGSTICEIPTLRESKYSFFPDASASRRTGADKLRQRMRAGIKIHILLPFSITESSIFSKISDRLPVLSIDIILKYYKIVNSKSMDNFSKTPCLCQVYAACLVLIPYFYTENAGHKL